MSQLAKVFTVNRKGFSLRGGVAVLAVLLVVLFAIIQLDQQKYFVTVVAAVLLVAVSDPGGDFARRAAGMAFFGLLGALLTALGFYTGSQAWGFVVLAAFVVTLLAGLTVKFGLHTFASGTLLNLWFIVAIALPASFHADRIPIHERSQALAWLIGAGVWIAFTCLVWLASGRKWRPKPVIEIPGAGSPVTLTRPMILFALIRAVALSASVAIAFGLHLPNADWMPIATLVAMKPSLEQSSLVALQRVVGAALGAVVAIPILLLVDNKHALEVIIILLVTIGVVIRGVNYAYYTAAIAAAALVAIDLPHPSNYASEGRRVLFTFIGVGIGVFIMFIASLLQKRSAKRGLPQPA